MCVRFCVIVLLNVVVSCVFGASVALHLVNSSVKLYNVTFVDNSTKSVLNDAEDFNLPFKLTFDNATNLDSSTTDEAGNGSGNNFTTRDNPSPPPSVAPENVDVQLKSLESNVTDDLSTANSTLNSTSKLSPQNDVMDKRELFDIDIGSIITINFG
ncbi:uncharacterized protein LOC124315635 isoform X2 [Daphnia pulicaria]|uniref:uncharacterized protein LOC124315635 isoform X2 n=1 Tax=Daphnia pulicaria TaxID=35523 RepID=UPI001EEB1DC9|nr:uncharacterized protein LOC124315635 isoform X2 [Daphnia pulicaria]